MSKLVTGKVLLAILGLSIATSCSDDEKESRLEAYKVQLEASKAQEEACKKDPSCLDSRAKKLSKDERRVAHSATGNSFLYGELCINNCSEFIAGYDWADKRGITKGFGCKEHTGFFIEGCLAYVEERKEELHTDDDTPYVDEWDAPDCRPGRHGDC